MNYFFTNPQNGLMDKMLVLDWRPGFKSVFIYD